MTVVHYGHDVIPFNANSIVTVGTFDGVHCGHRGIVERMKQYASEHQSRLVVVTFDPHPQIVLQKPDRKAVRLLTTLRERLEVLQELNVDLVVVVPFTKEFAATPPEEFVRSVLVQSIGVQAVFIGHDHMFGKDRSGNIDLLNAIAVDVGFSVVQVPALECNNIVVSSTKIRQALEGGDVYVARQMLGRPYSLSGTIVRGDGRGRSIGIPTANILPDDPAKLIPANGVYAVLAFVGNQDFEAVANIGVRPTFTADVVPTIEVHLLGFDDDAYGKSITVQFLQYLRGEQRFASKELLVEQISNDIQQTQTFFQTHYFRTTS